MIFVFNAGSTLGVMTSRIDKGGRFPVRSEVCGFYFLGDFPDLVPSQSHGGYVSLPAPLPTREDP